MYHLPKAVACFIFLQGGMQNVSSKELKGQPSQGNFIIHEKYHDAFSWEQGLTSITSNVPVTIQRYSDDYYMEGEQPVNYNEAKVLVTSDCAATTYVPQVTFGRDSINVNVQGAPPDTSYLDSSSYDAEWDYENYWCRYYTDMPTAVPVRPPRLNEREPFSLSSSVRKLYQRIMIVRTRSEELQNEDEAINALSSAKACNVNVEIMYDGCTHDVQVSAPTVRVIDSVLENQSSEQNSEDECIYDHEADITFPGEPEGMQRSLKVPSVTCHRAVPGRPFVDSTGSTLQAASHIILPSSVDVGSEANNAWSGDNNDDLLAKTSHDSNSTLNNQNQLKLGEEWTRSALGEHASVASFSAFSIALMTNQAPSDLVEDALNAALDEVRHARTSFDIASRLSGRHISPGPLPESTHTFGHDLKALALAVAQQGCVDETLSALEAAAEVNLINTVLLENNHNSNEVLADGTKYSGIDKDILTWIRDELNTIAIEESGHADLAWRTIKWVCSVEPDTCNAVEELVLSEEQLEMAFERRFQSFSGKAEIYDAMKQTWKKIYTGREIDSQTCDDDGGFLGGVHQHISDLTENIIRSGVAA